ncbi:MAG TPA: tyrosine-protein phosphatase [Ktedonobacteraceae bacterium]|nr:tyrosine-protein phosphatase [Ktedonobacteraceae bacterium]
MEQPVEKSIPLQRRLELEGSYNIRDIGGYATLDGYSTRWRVLLRGDSLHALPQQSQRLLLAYPVRTIIDLRRSSELLKVPSIFAASSDVRYINVSLLEDQQKVRDAPSLQELYQHILEMCQPEIQQILQLMATADIFPCVVHCAVGKDRTGLIIALLLSIANVPVETIASDYALSAGYLEPFFEILRARAAREAPDAQRSEWLLSALPETMIATLEYVKSRYGSVNDYLLAIGLTSQQLATLRSILVE